MYYFHCISFLQKHLDQGKGGYYWTSYIGQHWDEFSLDHVRTGFVHIEVLEVYTSYNNGFIEVEFYTGISELYYICSNHTLVLSVANMENV